MYHRGKYVNNYFQNMNADLNPNSTDQFLQLIMIGLSKSFSETV